MKNKSVLLIRVLTCIAVLFSGAIKSQELDDKINKLASKYEKDVIEWRHHIHQNPELSNREFNTAKMIADHLKSLDFDEVITGIAPTGVVGILKGGKPGDRIVALRADIDALPVREISSEPFKSEVIDNDFPGGPFPVAHACGHDTHVAMLMGAASVLAEMREDISGTIMFIFQPAEEGPPLGEQFGAQAMVDAGIFDKIKPGAVFGMHISPYPVGTIGYAIGPQNGASEVITINIKGKQVHGSTPFAGLDPLPVLAAINNGIGQIYRQIDPNDPFTVSIGKIETVGRTNIIGDSIVAYGTVRAFKDKVMEDINMRLERIVTNAAEMHGLTATFSVDQHVPVLDNKEDQLEIYAPVLDRIVGKENTFQIRPNMGYDDISVFMNHLGGGVYFLLGGQETKLSDDGGIPLPIEGGRGMKYNHNPAFYALDEALINGVKLHAFMAMEYLNN
jgi:amidohydrolase